jgi:hypothetical protein
MRINIFALVYCVFLMPVVMGGLFAQTGDGKSSPRKTLYNGSGDASGHFDLGQVVVYGFSHDAPDEDDPQVYEKLVPDLVMRGWHAGWTDNLPASRYNLGFLNKCHEKHILFMGGLNGSAVYRSDAANEKEFQDWSTLDAEGSPVTHTECDYNICKDMRRASVANPNYREHLMQKIRMQIDLGADGIVVDEMDADGYYGNAKYHFNANEGFDDYFIADFNRYLMEKYPRYREVDWIKKFQMTRDNVIKRGVPAGDLKRNFNYRKYLQLHDWATDPKNRGWGGKNCSANPLAAEWGAFPASSRLSLDDPDFLNKAFRLYWKQMVIEMRQYARKKYHKEILVTANGLFPYVDFNEFGLWNYNHDDEGGKEADYMPVTSDGHLNGSKSLKKIFKSLYQRNRAVAGQVPMVLFLDWPTTFISHYYALPQNEKEDFWQIYAPEAYSCGLFYAFHLRVCYDLEPSATKSGVIDFLARYAQFYKDNRDLYFYKETTDTDLNATVGIDHVESNITDQVSRNRSLLHLINHNYDKRIIPKSDFTVTLDTKNIPLSVQLVSPDIKERQKVDFSFSNNQLAMKVKNLKYYDVLVINWK